MKPFFIGMILGWIVLPLIGLLYLRFAYVPVAVDGPVIPFESLLAGAAVQATDCARCSQSGGNSAERG